MHNHAYINGQWTQAADNKRFDIFNPANGQTITDVADCGATETRTAITAAHHSFAAWSGLLATERASFLWRFHDLILRDIKSLALLLTTEQGKPLAEAESEIKAGAASVQWAAEEARRIYGTTVPSHKPASEIIISRHPVGVVAAITPWNFPHSMITRKIAPALAAGCTVVLKPAEDTPLSALALAALAHEAGIPAGVLNVVPTSTPATVGDVLCADPRIAKLSFTGSTAVGRHLMAACAPTLKRLSLELGGNAPFIIFDDANLEAAVAGAMQSKFRNAGQTCVCTNRFYVQRGIHDAFVAAMKKAIESLKIGAGDVENVKIGPLINKKGLDKAHILVTDALSRGATLECGGKITPQGPLFYSPTLITGANATMRIAQEEVFGPIAAIFPFNSEDEAMRQANDVEHGLAAYVYTSSLGRAHRARAMLAYGMVGINDGLLSTETAPFGGIKQSGFGREGGASGMNEFTYEKYSLIGGLG